MAKPDATQRNTDPAYIDGLVVGTGLNRAEVARILGIGERTLRTYTKGEIVTPYPVQFCLECLAKTKRD